MVEELEELEEFNEKSEQVEKKKPEKCVPLVVCDETGAFLFLTSTNKSGFQKSLEQNALWIVNPDSDRLLPSGKEAALKALEDRESYFYAEVLVSGKRDANESLLEADVTDEEETTDSLGVVLDPGEAEDLVQLAKLVAQRRRERPRGSYTTHLFEGGIGKIRKRTGKEAVELILARSREDTVRETADLLYHLLVLLEAEEIGLGPVLRELRSRTE